MNIYKYDIVFQEVPDHISLAFYVCGCALRCPGCHSTELWSESNGFPLTTDLLQHLLSQYKDRISCVLFLGGEWRESDLLELLTMVRRTDVLTALYTGETSVSDALKNQLDFLKTGPWRRELGGLDSPTTNQIFYDLKNGLILNHLFQSTINKENSNDPTFPGPNTN